MALAKGKVPNKYVERGFPVFSPLYLRTQCLHWLAIKLAKIIKIPHCNRPKITLECCWFRHEKNVVKNTEKIRFICGTILPHNKTPPPSFRECITYGKSPNIVNAPYSYHLTEISVSVKDYCR